MCLLIHSLTQFYLVLFILSYLFNIYYELSWCSGIVLGDKGSNHFSGTLSEEIVKTFKCMVFALMVEKLVWKKTQESTVEGTYERGEHSGRLHRSSPTTPQSLILNPLGQMYFGIQNSLDLSKVIQCIYNVYYLPSRVYGSTLESNTLMFLHWNCHPDELSENYKKSQVKFQY